jgi:hypothetical protein
VRFVSRPVKIALNRSAQLALRNASERTGR